MSIDWQRIKQVLAEAAEHNPPAERAAYLDDACRGDEPLRVEVEKLLKAHDQAGGFLEQPAIPVPELAAGLSAPLTEKPGDWIGPYKLLQQIGEGGGGVVYLAEQERPIRRRVALKVIKLGMDTKSVIARFEAERQALALMDHPHIARVLDAGATGTGRPYFVMELVRGIKITEFCDRHHLSTEARLDLFVQVCHALQHAHQKGIIHRDIKPSNILVTRHDGTPMPKVIDFGIAKATDQRLTDKTLFTAFEQFIGTPAYMSPEQAQMSGMDIDTRSDIYSLGVLLYELLTGQTPFDPKELVSAGLDGMRRIIREEEPKRPSTRLSTLAATDQTTVAKCRQSEPSQLVHRLEGDLDWIVMRCLEKDRTRRYETAHNLAEDVLRYLNNEPVTARPPSMTYRFQKLVQRNKVTFAAGAMVTAALVLGLGFSLWTLAKERVARRQALAAEQKAQAEAGKSRQVAKFLKDMLQGVGPSVALGRDTTMLREILDKTAERVGKDLKGQPAVEAELRMTLGDVYGALSQFPKAESMHREALELRRTLWGRMHTNTAESLDCLGMVMLQDKSQIAAGVSLIEQALAIRTNLLGREHLSVAASMQSLAVSRVMQGRIAEGVEHLKRSLAMRRKLQGNENLETAQALVGLSAWLPDLGKLDEAEAAAREAIDMASRLRSNPLAAPLVASAETTLSAIYRNRGKLEEAIVMARKTLATHRRLLGNDHPELASFMHNLANALIEANELEEAETVLRDALALSRKVFGGRNRRTAFCWERLGEILRRTGRFAEAETAYREALAFWADQGHFNAHAVHLALEAVLRQQGKLAEIEELARDRVAAVRKTGSTEALAYVQFHEYEILKQRDKTTEAEPLLREAIDLARKSPPSETGIELRLLGVQFLEQARRWDEAWALLGEGMELEKPLPESAVLLQMLGRIGDQFKASQKWAEAEAAFRAGLDICRRRGSEPEQGQWLASGLAVTLKQQERWGEAEAYYRESLTHCATIWPGDPMRWQWQFADLREVLRRQDRTSDAEAVNREMLVAMEKTPLPAEMSRLKEALNQPATWLEAESLIAVLIQTAKRCPPTPEQAGEIALQAVKLAALQVWFGRETNHAAFCQQMLEWAATEKRNATAERMVKLACLRPLAGRQTQKAFLKIARADPEIMQMNWNRPWSLLSLGMAEYRCGNYSQADRMLSAAELGGPTTWRPEIRAATARFYRAMSLFHQGKQELSRQLFRETEAKINPLPAAGQWPLSEGVDQDDLVLWLACKEASALLSAP